MTEQQLEKRRENIKSDPLVVVRDNGDLRVYSAADPGKCYVVKGSPDAPECNCADFRYHRLDPEWRCKHILAALDTMQQMQAESEQPQSIENAERAAIQAEGGRPAEQPMSPTENGTTQMLIKRSVSPDGRIDSLSVEFACAVQHTPSKEIRCRAFRALVLQSEIVRDFMNSRTNSCPHPSIQSKPEPVPEGPAIPARMIEIGGMDSRWGRRLFINIEANGETLKLFGSYRQLEASIKAAGFPQYASDIQEGRELNLPCRIITQPSRDGRYLNVAQVLPLQQQLPQRRFH